MLTHGRLKFVACLVIVTYSTVCIGSSAIAATDEAFSLYPTFLLYASQATDSGSERGISLEDDSESQPQPQPIESMAEEEQNALRQIYTERVQSLESDIDTNKGVRKNLLSVAVAAFAIGTTVAFAVNNINDAIDKIPVGNPEDDPCPDCTTDDRHDACEEYVSFNQEKRDAQDSLDGIKGLGGGIFIAGIVSTLGYWLYTWNIHKKQQKIDAIRTELDAQFAPQGLTPAYLQRNESVAAVMEEIENLKQQAGSAHTIGDIFSRLALGGLASGLFLMGVSNVSHTIVDDITINEEEPEDVAAKQDALDKTDELQDVGVVLVGVGAAAGIASYVFNRIGKGKEDRIDELRESILRVAEGLEIRPRWDGFMVMYSYSF